MAGHAHCPGLARPSLNPPTLASALGPARVRAAPVSPHVPGRTSPTAGPHAVSCDREIPGIRFPRSGTRDQTPVTYGGELVQPPRRHSGLERLPVCECG